MQFFNNLRGKNGGNTAPEDPPTTIENNPAPALPAPDAPGFETVLGASTVTEGTLACEGNLRLDGTFRGTLKIKGNVLVGPQALIEADINAHHISIAGEVRGNVSGQKVQLLKSARVHGDITTNRLSTAEGALIDGRVTMKTDGQTGPPPPESKVTREISQIIIQEDDHD